MTTSHFSSDNLVEIVHELISILNPKEQEVIQRRYGIQKEKDTLAGIGKDFKVTRERIRQIQAYGLKKLQRNAQKTNLVQIKDWAIQLLRESGDILTETTLESALKVKFKQADQHIDELKLATILFDEIQFEPNKINFLPHFRLKSIKFKTIKQQTEKAIKILKQENKPLSPNKLVSMLQERNKKDAINLRKKLLLAAIKLDRRIIFKDEAISLVDWRHINPKTLYDKILFILRKTESPLHFSEITNMIIDENFDEKNISQQAVHNELINKLDFVLVGRGVYALKEWGYVSGTVKDVLVDILEKEGPMPQATLLKKVLEVRKVKPITVQININNKEHFSKTRDSLITLA